MGKKINEVGNVYGKLTVIEEFPERKNGRIQWICKCECGNECVVSGSSLRNGKTKSCGCSSSFNFIDLTGQTFGKWTVLEQDKNKIGTSSCAYWICQCECGTIKSVSSRNLRSGNSKSCGCSTSDFLKKHAEERLNLVGQRFGRLTVIKRTEERNAGGVIYECQCDCGNIIKTSTHCLTTTGTSSCGCLQKEKVKEYYLKNGDLTGQKFGKLTVLERVEGKRGSGGGFLWKCKCDCGNIVEVSGNHLRDEHTISCGCINSKGEMKVAQILRDNNIPFEVQKIFNDCRNKETNAYFRFDFYINNKYIIEYDGEQHFYETGFGSLEDNQRRDNIKNQYCKDNNIPIIRIPYTRYDDLCLEDLLLETSQYILN